MEKVTRDEIKKNGFPKIPMLIDCMQEFGEILEMPEIRVWCHSGGDDGYHAFKSFEEAWTFIKSDEGKKACCEDVPLLAFRGFELNLWGLPQLDIPVRTEDPPPTPFRKRREEMKLNPTYDRIVVSRDKASDKSPGGIVLPEQAQDVPLTGTVLAVGSGKLSDMGNPIPLPFRVGQKVLFGKYTGVEVTLDKEEFTILRAEDVLAIVEA